MIGSNLHTRRPGPPVPTRPGARVSPISKSADTDLDQRGRALVPVKSSADPKPANDPAPGRPANDVAQSCAKAGLWLQCDAPAPRRGLRADAVERQRYRDTYEAAGRAPVCGRRPQLVRSA